MPVHVDNIIASSKPLDEKIFEYLAANPDQFYTPEEIQTALGEFSSFTVLGAKAGWEGMLAGLLADAALAQPLGEIQRDTKQRYAMALTNLVASNRIKCVNYAGALRFGRTRSLPAWVDQPSLVAGE